MYKLLCLLILLLGGCSKEATWYCNAGAGSDLQVCRTSMSQCQRMLRNLDIDDVCVSRTITAWGYLTDRTDPHSTIYFADRASCERGRGLAHNEDQEACMEKAKP